jgi:segregation and condensation protein B
MELTAIVESLLFATQEPLPLTQMAAAVKETAKDIKEAANDPAEVPSYVEALLTVDELSVREAIDSLIAHYEKDGRAFTIAERPHGWRLCAKADYAEWCRALFPGKKVQRLSQPALETLAIIAYRQPITKAGIEAVRGVSVDAMVQQLVDRGLIKIEGRAELPGKPLLYGTTESFLDHFAVKNLDELPNSQELRRVKLPTAPEEQPGNAAPEETQLSLEPQPQAESGEAAAAPEAEDAPAAE